MVSGVISTPPFDDQSPEQQEEAEAQEKQEGPGDFPVAHNGGVQRGEGDQQHANLTRGRKESFANPTCLRRMSAKRAEQAQGPIPNTNSHGLTVRGSSDLP
jgi:hypothetical protein